MASDTTSAPAPASFAGKPVPILLLRLGRPSEMLIAIGVFGIVILLAMIIAYLAFG